MGATAARPRVVSESLTATFNPDDKAAGPVAILRQAIMKVIRNLLFVLGCILLLLFLLLPNASHLFHVLGWAGLLTAYFLWIGISYMTKSPLFTRGGLLLYDERPRFYTTVHIILALAGLFMLLVFVTVNFV